MVLDRVTDVRNFGAFLQNGRGAGVDTILIPEQNSSAINVDAVKTFRSWYIKSLYVELELKNESTILKR